MGSLIALAVAIGAIYLARGIQERMRALEVRVDEQDDEIRALRKQVGQLKADREPKPAAPPPVPVAQPAVAPPPVTAPPPVVAAAPKPAPPPVARPDTPPRPVLTPSAPPVPAAQAAQTSRPQPPVPPPPPPPSIGIDWSFDWEQLVGVKLFSAIAGIALVFAAVFFLRYSIEHGWLQPPVRVAIGVLTGIALLVTCELKAARKYPITANALDAAAIAILFATFFAAHALWQLIPAAVAFGLLALVTATAVLLSVRHESLFVAVLGLVGGFATPLLLSTGENRPISLFSYLLLLNIGLAWVGYRRRWSVLTVLSAILTTIYQWGWVFKFLATSSLPLALAIFLVFPLVGYAGYLLAVSRPGTREHAAEDTFEWTALAASAAPLLFAVYLAVVRPYGERYGLLFGFLFLVNSGLFAIAVTRGQEILHVIGAFATLVVTAAWLTSSYAPGLWIPFVAIAIGFMAFYMLAPIVAEKVRHPLGEVGRATVFTAPLLMFVFPVLARVEPAVASPAAMFAIVFALLVVHAWRSLATGNSFLYYVGVFFALAAEAVWSATHLTMERLNAAMVLYAAFGLVYFAVPLAARRLKLRLEPVEAGAIALNASLLLVLYLAGGPLAGPAMWGIALLLLVMNAAIFAESVATLQAWSALAGSILSWFVIFAWWINARAAVGLLPSLWMVVGLACATLAGHAWTRTEAKKSALDGAALEQFQRGSWLALVAFAFLFASAAYLESALPPWPLFGALVVVALAVSTASLAARDGALHLASCLAASIVLLVWIRVIAGTGYGAIAISAEGVLVAFTLAMIPLGRRFYSERLAAIAATAAIVIGIIAVTFVGVAVPPPSLPILASALVIGISLLLALTARYAWPFGSTATAAIAAVVLFAFYGADDDWQRLFVLAIAMYVPFAVFPLLLGTRAEDDRDPYLAAIVASVWCFLAARYCVLRAGYEWMIGVVPVALGAVTTLHVRQLLKVQPKGARDLGRLALVAGTALAFATVAIPLQLSQQWITIGWALEGAAVAWLYRRVPHRGLLLASVGLLGAVFVRLALNPEVFRYEPRGSLRIWNWYLYSYLICAAAMFLAAWWLSKTDDEVFPGVPRPRYIMPAAGGILLFLLLNIEIADFYATGPEIMFRFGAGIAQDLTYTIGWLLFGLATLAVGIVLKNRASRIAAVGLITVTTLKCFLYDLSSLGGLYRVGAFVGLALSLTLVSLALQKFVLNPREESGR